MDTGMLGFDWDGNTLIEELGWGGRCPRLWWMYTVRGAQWLPDDLGKAKLV